MRLLWADSETDSDEETVCVTDTPTSLPADPLEVESVGDSPQRTADASPSAAVPAGPESPPPIADDRCGMVLALELHNFKSYRGTVRICDFSKFTAIIGPNGCGKSNLMDAISFVLCVSSTVLRGLNLKDLIHKPGGAGEEPSSDAHVALTLHGAHRPVVFRRQISRAGTVGYFLDDAAVSFKQYKEALREYRINTLGSTGLIFQGAVNDIAARSPTELTRLFETISGSSLYAKPYSYIKEKLERRRVEYRDLVSRKRSLQQELRQYRSMISGSSNYDDLLSQYKRAEARKHACEFRRHALKFAAHMADYTRLSQRASELDERWSSMQAKRDELERQRSALYFEQGQLHRTIQDKQRVVLSKKESMHHYYEAKSALEQRIAALEALRQSIEADVDNLQRERQELTTRESQLSGDLAATYAELEALRSAAVSLTPLQRQRYDALLQSFNRATAGIRIKLNIGRGKIAELANEGEQIRGELEALRQGHAKLLESTRPGEALHERLSTRLRETKDSIELVSMTHSRLERERSQAAARRQALQAEKAALDEHLKTLNVAKVEYRQILRRRQYTQELMTAIPGVHGEVLSLCEIINACYHDGIMAALNTRGHTIVTDGMPAIQACIAKLRRDRVYKRDFLPLDSLRHGKSEHRGRISELFRSRGLRVQHTFAIDCLVFQRQYGALFEHLLGDTVLVATLEDAERLIAVDRGGSLSFNVVTQKGQVITRDRTIILDSAVYSKRSQLELELAEFGRLSLKSDRLDQDIALLTKRLSTIEASLADSEGKLQSHRRALELLQMKVDFAQRHLQASRQQIEGSEAKIASVSSKLASLESTIASMRASSAQDEAALAGLQQSHFENLNDELGVSDIHGLMTSRLESAERLEAELDRQRALLARCERDKQELESRIEHLCHVALFDAADRHQSALAELHTLMKNHQSLNRELCALEQGLKSERERFDSLSREIERCHERIKFLQYDRNYGIDQVEGRCAESDPCDDAGTPQSDPADSGSPASRATRAVPLSESKETVSSQLLELTASMRELQRAALELAENCRLRNVDCVISVPDALVAPASADFVPEFPQLAGADLDVPDDPSALDRAVAKLDAEMQSLRKSLGASRACDDAEVRLQRAQVDSDHLDAELASAKADCGSLESDFERIKKERTSLFLNCFQSVKRLVGPIYRSLSAQGDSDEPNGGSAFLTLDDDVSGSVSEPFLCSIRYNTMPPMKKFLDLSLQSGGEKAVSSLALLLALHSFRQSPFVVLDEIDANLDNVKVQSLVSFLQRSAFQVIVISLKPRLFSQADVLVGVYSHRESASSSCVVLNLSEYATASEGAREPPQCPALLHVRLSPRLLDAYAKPPQVLALLLLDLEARAALTHELRNVRGQLRPDLLQVRNQVVGALLLDPGAAGAEKRPVEVLHRLQELGHLRPVLGGQPSHRLRHDLAPQLPRHRGRRELLERHQRHQHVLDVAARLAHLLPGRSPELGGHGLQELQAARRPRDQALDDQVLERVLDGVDLLVRTVEEVVQRLDARLSKINQRPEVRQLSRR
ncbi:structural maintenance of chromosome protein, type 1 [Babesia caballi]|uniref:Structural maintenance of chromosomes protein n=1 Tax=Babesia caballi TaxID=5871 RepID=A0AAV4M1K0_BABCB|nr:structural maintenance of chromosome protein, type 1 [Babesia caballi]